MKDIRSSFGCILSDSVEETAEAAAFEEEEEEEAATAAASDSSPSAERKWRTSFTFTHIDGFVSYRNTLTIHQGLLLR